MKFGKVLACRTRRAGEPQDEGTIERIAASRIAEQAEGRPPRLGQSPRECCHRVVRPRSADADNGDGGRRIPGRKRVNGGTGGRGHVFPLIWSTICFHKPSPASLIGPPAFIVSAMKSGVIPSAIIFCIFST